MSQPLVNIFLDAVRVDALSLRERPMAEFVRRTLDSLPVVIREDDAGRTINGECGNLICIPEGFDPARPAFALLAHLDTPRSTANVKPVVDQTKITSDGTTALGVDNRAGTSVLLHTLREHLRNGATGNFLVIFTVAEEIGPFGSKYLDLSPYNIKTCFVFDCSKRPGVFIRSAVGCSTYKATFIGRSSHAGVSPEQGINAIQLAARAISSIPMGRLAPKMTSNIGVIAGGAATNVVPDWCVLQGELRAFEMGEISKHLQLVEREFRAVAESGGGRLEFSVVEEFPPFVLDPTDDAFLLTEDILRSVSLEPHGIEYLGGSDANQLNAKGIPSFNLGIGAQNPHSNEEFILLEDLDAATRIAREIIHRSRSLS